MKLLVYAKHFVLSNQGEISSTMTDDVKYFLNLLKKTLAFVIAGGVACASVQGLGIRPGSFDGEAGLKTW